MHPIKFLAYVAFLLIGATGCSHFPLASDYKGPRQLPPEIKNEYSYRKFAGVYEEKICERKDNYTLKQIRFPSSHDILLVQHDIHIDYYDISRKRPEKTTPVIIILPILGGSNDIEKFFAKYFANNGYAAILVHRQEKYKEMIEDPDKIDIVLRQIVFDHKQALDWIETRPELDAGKIGAFGISMGAINGALLASLDERVKISVLALGGGDIPYILSYSTEEGIVKKRKELLKKKGMTIEELCRHLEKKVRCDPLSYAEYLDARNILMFFAMFDRVVPFSKGEELRKKIGEPETIYLFGGHYTAVLYIFYARYTSLQFFKKKFGGDNGPPNQN